MTTDHTRAHLLAVARRAIRAQVLGDGPELVAPALTAEASGVFVTLTRKGELRGCLGVVRDEVRVADAVARLAGEVCHEDPRFRPITPSELPELHIEISVLTPLERVREMTAIQVGRHGLVVEQGARRGLLLPQVATEHGWDRETFLAQTCVKAGLQPSAWRHEAWVFRFEAEVFGGPFVDAAGRQS